MSTAHTIVMPVTGTTGAGGAFKSFGWARSYVAKTFGANFARSSIQSDAADAIMWAIARWNRETDWRYRVMKESIQVVTAGTSLYPLPAEFSKIYSVRVGEIPVQQLAVREIDRVSSFASVAGQAPPLYYDLANQAIGMLEIYPTPTATGDILSIRYHALISEPLSDSDLFVIPTKWLMGLLDLACGRFLLGFEAERGRAQAFLVIGERALKQAVKDDIRQPDQLIEIKSPMETSIPFSSAGSALETPGGW
jgi:hypothetical protein